MRIEDIYCVRTIPIVSLVTAFACVVITLITICAPSSYNTLAYAFPVENFWQVCSGIFVHGTPDMPLGATIGHLVFNLLLVLPFGIMTEKIIGSKKLAILFLIAWAINSAAFFVIASQMTPAGETAYGAGISGIAFTYGIIGMYVLYRLLRNDAKLLFKQVSFYLLLSIVIAMIIMINPFVAGVSSMIMHLVAVITGIVYIAIERRTLDGFIRSDSHASPLSES